ncbi:MAG: hypothetical protein Q8Q11_03840 [bacterium]|nr:hypothetical protein [bacterium]
MSERYFESVLGDLDPQKLERAAEFVMAQEGHLPESREELEMQRRILEKYIDQRTAGLDPESIPEDETLREVVRCRMDLCNALAGRYGEEYRALSARFGIE